MQVSKNWTGQMEEFETRSKPSKKADWRGGIGELPDALSVQPLLPSGFAFPEEAGNLGLLLFIYLQRVIAVCSAIVTHVHQYKDGFVICDTYLNILLWAEYGFLANYEAFAHTCG